MFAWKQGAPWRLLLGSPRPGQTTVASLRGTPPGGQHLPSLQGARPHPEGPSRVRLTSARLSQTEGPHTPGTLTSRPQHPVVILCPSPAPATRGLQPVMWELSPPGVNEHLIHKANRKYQPHQFPGSAETRGHQLSALKTAQIYAQTARFCRWGTLRHHGLSCWGWPALLLHAMARGPSPHHSSSPASCPHADPPMSLLQDAVVTLAHG